MRIVNITVIAAVALSLAGGAPVSAQQPAGVRIPASVLEKYVGEYVYPDGASFLVSRAGDTLFQEVPGRRLVYTPLTETRFMMGPVFTADFLSDNAGGFVQVLSDGVGIEIRLRKKGSKLMSLPLTAVQSAPAVRLPRPVLERYVGVYEYIPGQMNRTDLRVSITLDGENLVREGAGPTAVLVPLSESRFRVGNTSFIVEFVIDEAGVTQVMGTGFQQMLARLPSRR